MPGIRALEAAAQADLPPGALMDRAGEAAARLALAVAPHARRVWIACGPGNNGGDGLVCAARLLAAGREVVITRVEGDPAREPADARQAAEAARAVGVAIGAGPPPALGPHDLVIDALLGIGATRPPAGAVAERVREVLAAPCPVLALDVPTGLDADTGCAVPGLTVRADHTLTFLVAKPGLFTGDGRDHAGRVWLADLGVAVGGAPVDAASARLAGPPVEPRRSRHRDHKGSLGDVLVIGGAAGMAGAAELAAGAAHAAGAGRVYLHRLDGGGATRTEIMRLVPPPASGATLAAAALDRTTVAGCGGGSAIAPLLPALLGTAARLVLDADALNAVAGDGTLQRLLRQRTGAGQPTVLTPHPLEAARLLGTGTAEVQADRLAAARTLAAATGATVVLKGSGTVVSDPAHGLLVNPTGGPALATPGSGDVLAGWIGGLWAGWSAADGFAAARAAVWWHGCAAEAVHAGPLRAADLIEAIWAARAAGAARPTTRG